MRAPIVNDQVAVDEQQRTVIRIQRERVGIAGTDTEVASNVRAEFNLTERMPVEPGGRAKLHIHRKKGADETRVGGSPTGRAEPEVNVDVDFPEAHGR